MKGITEKYREKDLTVIWIGFQDRMEKIKEFSEKHNLASAGYDANDTVSKKFGMTFGAGLVFINREGVVKARLPKGLSPSRIEAEIQKII